MKRKIVLMSFIFLSFFANISFSQIREIPKAVEKTFTEQYSGATNVKYNDQLVSVDVYFELNGEKMTAYYTNKGTWKETVKEYAFDKLPEEVKDGFQKSKYADRTVDETKILYKPGDSTQYRVRVKRSDIEKKYLYFNPKGRLLKESVTL